MPNSSPNAPLLKKAMILFFMAACGVLLFNNLVSYKY